MRRVMHILLCIALWSLTLPAAAQPSGFFEVSSQTDAMKDGIVLNGAWTPRISEHFGASAYFLVVSKYAQGYAGPTWMPNEQWAFNVSLGGEQDGGELMPRYAAFIAYKANGFSAFGLTRFSNSLFEGDDARLWYNIDVGYMATDWLFLGAKARRWNGVGPLMRFIAGPVIIWPAWTFFDPDTGETNFDRVLIGVIYTQ